MANSTAVVRRSVALPRGLAATSQRSRALVDRWLVREKILDYALAEIKRQLFAVIPAHAKDHKTGEWVKIGEKPDTRARQWAADRVLDLAGAYPMRDRASEKSNEEHRAKIRELISQHSTEPVAVLEFCWRMHRWPTPQEREELLGTNRQIIDASDN